MILYICGHDFHYEMENLCRVFFPNEKITVSDTLPESGAPEVETYLDGASGGYSVRVRVNVGDKTETRSAEVPKTDEPEKDECERTMARELFSALSAVTGYVPPWGILTGVRPSKLMLKLIESLGEKGAYDYFTKKLLVSEPKARLAQSVAGTEQEIAALGDERSFSLYIAIPFCPSRCSYCSFVSHSITNANAAKLLPVYVDDLCRELENGNREAAFRAAHTLKGVCANLSFTRLMETVSRLMEVLRPEADRIPDAAVELLENVKQDYQLTVDTIRKYQRER